MPVFARVGIEPIYALAAGVMLGGVLQLAVQVPALARIGVLPRIGLAPARDRAPPGAIRACGTILRQMAPALLGVSVAQLSMLINTQIASHQGVGAVSWLFYADRLMEFPTALLGVALGVVLMPQLSAAQGRGDAAALLGHARLGPAPGAAAGAAVRGGAARLSRGRWSRRCSSTASSTPWRAAKTASALRGYGVGLIGLIGVKILAPGFYARQDIRTPVTIAVVVLALTQAMNAVFVPLFGHAGLALSVGLGATINAVWLFVGLKRGGWYQPAPGWGRFAGCGRAGHPGDGRVARLGRGQHRLDRPGRPRSRCASAWLAACLVGAAAACTSACCVRVRRATFRPR